MPTAMSLTLHQDLSNRLPFECLVSCWEMNDHRVAGHTLKHAAMGTATADNNLDDITSNQVAEGVPTRLRHRGRRCQERLNRHGAEARSQGPDQENTRQWSPEDGPFVHEIAHF